MMEEDPNHFDLIIEDPCTYYYGEKMRRFTAPSTFTVDGIVYQRFRDTVVPTTGGGSRMALERPTNYMRCIVDLLLCKDESPGPCEVYDEHGNVME